MPFASMQVQLFICIKGNIVTHLTLTYLTQQSRKPTDTHLIRHNSTETITSQLLDSPSSVMIGMLEPVVTDTCRTNPCTGLLSGDDLSIPGGVKPEGVREG